MPDLDKILRMSEIFGVTTDFLLKDEMETEEYTGSTAEDSPLRAVSMEEANDYLAYKKTASVKIALGVLLCILLFVITLFSCEKSVEEPARLLLAKAKAMFADIENVLESEYGINTDRQKYHDSANLNMFMRKLSNAKSVNGLIIRIAWSCMYWDSRRIKIAQSMAEVIKKHVEPEVGLDLDPELKAKGIAYEGHTIE